MQVLLKYLRNTRGDLVWTTLVLVAVFIPVAVMGGITGRLYQQFAITVAVSVMFSSMNALTLSPALCSLLLRKQKPYRGPLGVFFKAFNRVFDKATDGYMWLSRKVARRITVGLVIIAALTVGTGFLGRMVPGGFMPEEDMGYLMVNIQLPDAASLQRSDVVSRKVEEIIKKELGYTDEELENLEIFTWDDLVAEYEETVKAMMGDELWEKLKYYIDIEGMIKDDLLSGNISKIKVKFWTLYVRER